MIQILLIKKIFQLLLMALAGYIIVRCGILRSSESAVLSKLCLYLMLPAAVIKSFQVQYDESVIQGLLIGAAAAFILHIVLILVSELAGRKLGLDVVERNSVIYSNAANLIIPIVTYVLGEEWIIYTTPYICVQLIFFWTHCVSSFRGEKRIEIRNILLNVNIIAIIIGLILLLGRIKLPDILSDTLGSLSDMMGPTALIVIGMIAAGMDIQKVFSRKRVYMTAALRLLAVPAAVLTVFKALMLAGIIENGSYLFLIILLACMTPPASTVTQFAQVFGGDAEYAGAINLVSTICCMVTMPVFVMLYLL